MRIDGKWICKRQLKVANSSRPLGVLQLSAFHFKKHFEPIGISRQVAVYLDAEDPGRRRLLPNTDQAKAHWAEKKLEVQLIKSDGQ